MWLLKTLSSNDSALWSDVTIGGFPKGLKRYLLAMMPVLIASQILFDWTTNHLGYRTSLVIDSTTFNAICTFSLIITGLLLLGLHIGGAIVGRWNAGELPVDPSVRSSKMIPRGEPNPYATPTAVPNLPPKRRSSRTD